MKYDITAMACRICLRKSSSCRSIFEPLAGDTAPNVKLNLLAGINVDEKVEIPGLPKCICKQCEIAVNTAFNLRKKARKADQILSVYCNKINKDNIIVELSNGRKFKLSKELTLRVIPTNKDPMVSSQVSSFQTNFEQVQVNEISKEGEKVGNDTTDKNDDKKINNIYEDEDFKGFDDSESCNESDDDDNEDERSVSDSDEKTKEENEKKISVIEKIQNIKNEPCETVNENDDIDSKANIKTHSPYNIEEIAKKIKASNQYELVSWKQDDDPNSVPTFKLRLKDPQEKPPIKDFICDVCGNSYAQKHRLMDHMRRHNPEKLFSCEICGKRFAVPEGLRRHVLTHGAKKPFKCHFCTRCFYTPSARKAHEKVHSGARPYKCKICSQSFAYSSSLRKHILIHENKKLYRCEYCDKDFRLQHHMKQHEDTQIHKDAVRKSKWSSNTKLL